MRAVTFAAIVLAGTFAGCARTLPADRSGAALYRDLQRLVSVTATAGWEVDRIEIDDMMAAALMSVCRVAPAQRVGLLAWVDAESRRRGGPVEDAWKRRGKRLKDVSELLELARIRMVLARAIVAAPDDCPFWLEPEQPFRGRQISDDHWQLSFGGGGKGILVHQGERTDINFGGAGRVVIGRNFGSNSGLYGGLEVGASASFPKDDAGGRGALELGLDVVTPLVYRYTLVNAYIETELGYLAHTTESADGDFEHGVHVGLAIGGRATRKRLLFPGAVLGLSYERTFPDDAEDEPLNMVKLGFRVALDWDW
jgi:hypothetical protein